MRLRWGRAGRSRGGGGGSGAGPFLAARVLATAERQTASSSAVVMRRFCRGADELRANTGRSSMTPGRRFTGWAGCGRPAALSGADPACFDDLPGASALPTPMKLVRRAGAVGGVTFVAPHRAAE